MGGLNVALPRAARKRAVRPAGCVRHRLRRVASAMILRLAATLLLLRPETLGGGVLLRPMVVLDQPAAPGLDRSELAGTQQVVDQLPVLQHGLGAARDQHDGAALASAVGLDEAPCRQRQPALAGSLSIADAIVLAGAAAIEKAAKRAKLDIANPRYLSGFEPV